MECRSRRWSLHRKPLQGRTCFVIFLIFIFFFLISCSNKSIFTGLDFYLYKGLYIGAELGLNINSHKVLEREEKKLTSSYNSLDRKTKTEETEVKYEDELRTTSVRFKVEPAIRLGWTF